MWGIFDAMLRTDDGFAPGTDEEEKEKETWCPRTDEGEKNKKKKLLVLLRANGRELYRFLLLMMKSRVDPHGNDDKEEENMC